MVAKVIWEFKSISRLKIFQETADWKNLKSKLKLILGRELTMVVMALITGLKFISTLAF